MTWLTLKSDATRLAALISGEVDMILDPPLPDVERLKREAGMAMLQMPDIGQQYLTFDQSRDELQDSDVKGRNPFKDLRVRRAVYHAINVDLIVQKVAARARRAHGQLLVEPRRWLATRAGQAPAL